MPQSMLVAPSDEGALTLGPSARRMLPRKGESFGLWSGWCYGEGGGTGQGEGRIGGALLCCDEKPNMYTLVCAGKTGSADMRDSTAGAWGFP